MTTMTALEAFQASADAEVYVQTADGEALMVTGMRHSRGIAVILQGAGGSKRPADYSTDETLTVRVVRW